MVCNLCNCWICCLVIQNVVLATHLHYNNLGFCVNLTGTINWFTGNLFCMVELMGFHIQLFIWPAQPTTDQILSFLYFLMQVNTFIS